LRKYHESNRVIVGGDTLYGGGFAIEAITTNNGFIYVVGNLNTVAKYHESNLALVGNTVSFSNTLFTVAVNNGFIYAAGGTVVGTVVRKIHESNLVLNINSPDYAPGGASRIQSVKVNNGFVYAGGYGPGFTAGNISKYHESNLAFVENSASFGGYINSIAIGNGYVYAGGNTILFIKQYHESNLVFVGNTPSVGNNVIGVAQNNGFVYGITAVNQFARKYYENNLALAATTPGLTLGFTSALYVGNGKIYISGNGPSGNRVHQHQDFQTLQEIIPLFNITQIKE
jgi:hypothetical protein